MFETTLAGSLPKPSWLATPNVLWAPWTLSGPPLFEAKDDATLLAIRRQEEAGIDIVSDGEQARQHFVHGFLAEVDGVDFDKKVRMGIRNNRYAADCPTVTAPLKRRRFVHEREARVARAATNRKLKFTLPGPMTLNKVAVEITVLGTGVLRLGRSEEHTLNSSHTIQSRMPSSA